MKKVLALLLALVMVFSMAACSSGEPESESVTIDAGEMNTDTEATWDTSKEDEIVVSVIANYYESGWKMMAEEYNKLHPETEVVIDVVADNDTLMQKVTTWFSADDLSDAADITHMNFVAAYASPDVLLERNQIMDFTPVLDMVNPYSGTVVRDYLYEADIQDMSYVHGVQCLPFDHCGVAIMVNKDMLKEYGLEVPATMEQFLACCQTLRDAGIENPILGSGDSNWFIHALTDAALRDQFGEFAIQPGDGLYDEASMPVNATYKYDPDNLACDKGLRMSFERMYKMFDTEMDLPRTESIWAEVARILKYTDKNYSSASGVEVVNSFEMQKAPFLVQGSWNVGVLNKDIQEMGEDGFEWCTIPFPSYENKPEGWASGTLRSLYVPGNQMGIIKTHGDDQDHLNRVLDFILYCYNPVGCAKMYEKSLNDGYFVQGNPAIKGVELPADIQQRLDGFVQEVSVHQDAAHLSGFEQFMAEDKGTYFGEFSKLISGEYTPAEFMEAVRPIRERKIDDRILTAGYDLDPATKDEAK